MTTDYKLWFLNLHYHRHFTYTLFQSNIISPGQINLINRFVPFKLKSGYLILEKSHRLVLCQRVTEMKNGQNEAKVFQDTLLIIFHIPPFLSKINSLPFSALHLPQKADIKGLHLLGNPAQSLSAGFGHWNRDRQSEGRKRKTAVFLYFFAASLPCVWCSRALCQQVLPGALPSIVLAFSGMR